MDAESMAMNFLINSQFKNYSDSKQLMYKLAKNEHLNVAIIKHHDIYSQKFYLHHKLNFF